MKRARGDSGVSREDVEALDMDASAPAAKLAAASSLAAPHGFDRASNEVLAARRIVSRASAQRAAATRAHFAALNEALLQTLQAQWTHNRRAEWSESLREYLCFAREIDAKFGQRGGALLTFGSGDCGQLAHGVDEDEDLMVPFPREIAQMRRVPIARVSCGGLHSAAVTTAGEVYTWGCNDDGALGRDGDENVPTRVPGFGGDSGETDRCALLVVGGDSHTAVVTTRGQVFTWGAYKDKEGKMWCDSATPKSSFKQMQPRPFLVKGLSNIVDVRAGSSFNLARTSAGRVFSWGLGEMGQLGRPVTADLKDSDGEYRIDLVFREHLTPALMQLGSDELPEVKAIGCGSYHSLVALSANGFLYTCGLNNYGQLGIGSIENCDELQLVEDLSTRNIAQVAGGTHHSVVLTTDGAVYTFGRADSGQLGALDECQTGAFKDRPQRVTFGSEKVVITAIACGSNHALAQTDDNRVFSWGYGDMLALGHGEEHDEKRPRELDWEKTKFGAAQILQADAGGQHSAIVAVKNAANEADKW